MHRHSVAVKFSLLNKTSLNWSPKSGCNARFKKKKTVRARENKSAVPLNKTEKKNEGSYLSRGLSLEFIILGRVTKRRILQNYHCL